MRYWKSELHLHLLSTIVLVCLCCLSSCVQKQKDKPPKKIDYIKAIPGVSDTIPQANIQQGEVLIAYNDCYTCHTMDKRSKGPAFEDIAKRYPVKDVYINLLAQKIITGGFGAWGHPVMSPHPGLSMDEARLMVAYILSLKK